MCVIMVTVCRGGCFYAASAFRPFSKFTQKNVKAASRRTEERGSERPEANLPPLHGATPIQVLHRACAIRVLRNTGHSPE